eukprot:TRINITY_DN4281_c0_g1_i1.p1 TRINITY_DN4281_c0_g1~~TRINITY_DN4281_c0_g1_i1.p1  ORF type:complete len:395 (-),score=144.27 TRINITY_DN4281_c0_g1_i1:107-1291(-)
MATGLYIVGAKRTAMGGFGGKLKNVTATDLAAHASKAAIKQANVDPKLIGSSIFGNVAQTSIDAPYLARHVALKSGLPISSNALTVNRLCGSGFQSVINACHELLLGEQEIVLAGGSENMSMAPYHVYDARWGTKLGSDLKMQDSLWAALTDSYIKTPMGITAENLAAKYSITRQDADAFALSSQQRWAAAQKEGRFDNEIVPYPVKGKKGPEEFKVDEPPRPDTSAEALARLPPVFKEGGTVTAGNASAITDGAAALIVATEQAVKQHKLTPLARVVGWSVAGVDPSIMGIGPVPAIKNLLAKQGLSLNQIDLFEVNEAFASQFLAVQKDLGLDPAKTNANGGAIALGHPLGASGTRILVHLTHELRRKNAKYGLGSACIGGGQGIAVLIERL